MALFPPRVTTFEPGDQGTVDTRSPARFLIWMVRQQGWVFLAMVVSAIGWFLPGALGPWLIGRAIDQGITAGDSSAVLRWGGLLLGLVLLGCVAGILGHTAAVTSWLIAIYGTMKRVTRKSAQLGHVITRRTPTGEVLSVSAGDSDTFGYVMDVLSRAIAALVAFAVVAVLVLRTSVPLGLAVLAAAPLLILVGAPLLRPLHRTQAVERNRTSELTSQATDIVAGLRILRGIGGEATFGQNYRTTSQRTRAAGVQAGIWQAAVEGLSVALSGLFLVLLTWLGVRELSSGRITVGELISFFGYAFFVLWPIQTLFEAAQAWVRGLVSARKTIAVLGQEPPWRPAVGDRAIPAEAVLVDERSGAQIDPGRLTIVVSAAPDDSAALADRLGRYLPTDTDPVPLDLDDTLKGRERRRAKAELAARRVDQTRRDEELAAARWGVTVAGTDLSELDLDRVREHVLVSDRSPLVFAGTLQDAVDPHALATREQAEGALLTAAAEDVYEALPGGWQGVLDERGRGLSGGQRQRLVLARALLLDAPVLVLVEPTSAVDAHTEARIAERVTEHRRGRTTIVMTVSPLWLHHADRVIWLVDGQVAAAGTHTELLTEPGYRAIVARGMEEGDDMSPDDR